MSHPDVVEAAVIGVPDPIWEERSLVVVVLESGVLPDAEQLRTSLADGFTRWQLPERWAFLDEVPKTSVGKFDKKALRQLHANGALSIVELTGPSRSRG